MRLTSNVGTIGEAAIRQVVSQWPELHDALGPETEIDEINPGRYRVQEFLVIDRHSGPDAHKQAVSWLRRRINDYISEFRPRIRDAVDQQQEL